MVTKAEWSLQGERAHDHEGAGGTSNVRKRRKTQQEGHPHLRNQEGQGERNSRGGWRGSGGPEGMESSLLVVW